MDFGGLDGLLCSENANNTNNNNNNSLFSAFDLDPKSKSYGGFKLEKSLSASATIQNQDQWRDLKASKDDFSKGMQMQMLLQQQRSNCNSVFSDNMLSFSSPNRDWNPPLSYCSRDTSGYGVRGVLAGVKGPFTPSQWMELEHQALIYKYITVNAPIPTNLLIPIRKALESAAFCSYPVTNLRHATYGWGGFQMGFSNSSDPEPGRCRRTDGKKWRCSRDAVADQKYCERHMNRGRHRSRKPVEPPSSLPNTSADTAVVSAPATVVTTTNSAVVSHQLNRNFIRSEKVQDSTSHSMLSPSSIGVNRPAISVPSEFGFVSSDSLLNPLQKTSNIDQKPQNSLHQFMDDWPHPDRTQLSISIPMSAPDFISSNSSPVSKRPNFSPLRMGLGVCNTTAHPVFDEMSQPTNQIPVSWETSSGGPLGEVLNHNANNSPSALNLMTNGWENSHQMALSPTGVLQKTGFGCFSNSSAGSSPRTDNSLLGSTLITSSLPSL